MPQELLKRYKKKNLREDGEPITLYILTDASIIHLLLGNGYACIVRIRVKLYYNITCHGVRAKITYRPVHISDCNDIIIFVLLITYYYYVCAAKMSDGIAMAIPIFEIFFLSR